MARRNCKPEMIDGLLYGAHKFSLTDEGELVQGDDGGAGVISRSQAIQVYTEQMNRLQAIASVYQTADRIITRDEITVKVIQDDDLKTTARSNGRDIELNAKMIGDIDDESLLELNGVNFHELAHVLFSPRQGSNLGIYARENKMFNALKLLEEARAEQLLISRYPAVRNYLEANIYMGILNQNPSHEWGKFFHLITGRTYLPLELRQIIMDKALAEYPRELILELHDIIHSYRNLAFPTDFDKAKELVARLAQIFGTDETPIEVGLPMPQEGGCDMPDKGRPIGKQAQTDLQKGKDKTPLESTSGKGNQPDNNAGVGDGTPALDEQEDTALSDEDKELINEYMERIKNDSQVRRDLSDKRKAILKSDSVTTSIGKARYLGEKPVSQEALTTAKRFSLELERLVRDCDPAWRTHTPRGRLNIGRTMNPDINAINEMFDEWDIGNEATDIEAVILADSSGSMGGTMTTVCETTWAIKRAVESINGSVTAYNFTHDSHTLYQAGERAKPRFMNYTIASGGTEPLRGLIEADRILSASRKSIKILFIITDGDWSETETCDEIIRGMNAKGFLTSLVFLSTDGEYKNLITTASTHEDSVTREWATKRLREFRHDVRVFHAVTKVRDIMGIARELITSSIKRGRVA
jgi:hypothetical protein